MLFNYRIILKIRTWFSEENMNVNEALNNETNIGETQKIQTKLQPRDISTVPKLLILPPEAPEIVDEDTMRIARAVVQRYVHTVSRYADALVRKLTTYGIDIDYSYSEAVEPRGFSLVMRFTIANVDKRTLIRHFRSGGRAIVRQHDVDEILRQIQDALIYQQMKAEFEARLENERRDKDSASSGNSPGTQEEGIGKEDEGE